MKVIATFWSTSSLGCAGIVVIEEDNTNDRKAYIGVGKGISEEEDTQAILSWGNIFPLDTILRIKYHMEKKKERKRR